MDYWKNADESKADIEDHLRNLNIQAEACFFGTQRNTNVVVKSTKTEKKSSGKSKVETALQSPNQPKSTEKTQEVSEMGGVSKEGEAEKKKDSGVEPELAENVEGSQGVQANEEEEAKRPVGEIEVKPKKKKSVAFQEKVVEEEASASAQRTPVQLSSSLRKPRRSTTPYHTAHNCRRCKIDKLESSAYRIEQIKLAESVGKHFVSVAFFNLAHECSAEPVRSLKMELKRCLSRHGNLGKQEEWIEALRCYGLPVLKYDEMVDSGIMVNPEGEPTAIKCTHEPKRSNTA